LEDVNEIIFDDCIGITPEDLLDVLDECLLMRYYKLKLFEASQIHKFVEKCLDIAKAVESAKTKFELQKLRTLNLVRKEIRHALKLAESKEQAIKIEMKERQAGRK